MRSPFLLFDVNGPIEDSFRSLTLIHDKSLVSVQRIDNSFALRYRREGARLILDIGNKMGLRFDTIWTGVIYFHRFYMFRSFKDFKRYVTATCCLFLGKLLFGHCLLHLALSCHVMIFLLRNPRRLIFVETVNLVVSHAIAC